MENNIKKPAKILIFSAPSGAGKGTIIHNMMSIYSELSFSVSATSREPRAGEKDGVEYYFLSKDEFKRRVEAGDFLEWEEYSGNYYGTLKSEIEKMASDGKVAVFEVEVRGATNLKKTFEENALWLFIKVPIPIIKERLMARGTDTEESIELRLKTAEEEMEYESKADVVIENIDLDKALKDTKEAISNFFGK